MSSLKKTFFSLKNTLLQSKDEKNARRNWDTVYVGEKGLYCD